MIVIIFFLSITLTILVGIITPVVREFDISLSTYKSKQSYFVSESGIEDLIYRIRHNKQYGGSETLVLGSSTATTTITNLSSSKKEITTIGDDDSRQRKIDTVLSTGVGTSFNYGVQTGRGGISFGNNSSIIGNVYANGDLTGSGSVTGTAVAANSSALSADQLNDSPSTPTNSINFRNSSSTADFAQSFQVSTSSPINKVQFYIKKVGSPANATVRLVTDSSGSPSTNNLLSTQGTLSASSVTTSYGWLDIVFSDNPTLYPGNTYWIIIDNSSSSSSNYYTLGANDSVYTSGAPKVGNYAGSWSSTSPSTLDSYFSIYLGGLTSTINGIFVGSNGAGDAWAHTITGATVSGTKYCQVGTGCNTSRTDPPSKSFPISDANITSWKNDATSGGTISGDYSVSSSNQSLGPKEITGNLSVGNGKTLTITGTLWVHGNISLSNNSTIKLASSYGTDDGVIVTDGNISITNNGVFAGSGTTGSYLMALTTSDCPTSSNCSGSYAIDVNNNAGAVILNAQKGTIHLNNNANLIEATGETLILDNNATVTYQSGLADMNFSSGPSGSWNISTWKETQ